MRYDQEELTATEEVCFSPLNHCTDVAEEQL